jgi:cell division protein FtsN
MTLRTAYYGPVFSKCALVLIARYVICTIFILFFLNSFSIFAQDESSVDEISVFLEVPRVGGGEISAVIKGEELYLSVTELFDFLKIKNVPSTGFDTITGFFIDSKASYLISRPYNSITYQGRTTKLNNGDLILTESNLYLHSGYIGKIFGLDCIFNFRSLSVVVDSKLELPLIKEMKLKEVRENLNRLKGEQKADTNIGRTYPVFKSGMADWSITSSEEIDGQKEMRANLTLGSMLAGGEAVAAINYSSNDSFTEKQQYYLWRYVNNDFQPLRQIMLGKISTHATSSIYNPVVGIQLTNTPTTFRRSFGTYRLSDKTEPGWIVELYVNNILVNYVKADASGFFTFEIPLVYGNSNVQLKYFSPWGEERVKEQNINIPFNFVPVNTLEYNIGAGIVEDTASSRYSRASLNYGLTRKMTIGGGIEYLSSVESGPTMPYVNASVNLFNNLMISGEYTYGVRAKGTLAYRLPGNLQFNVDYTKYDKKQKAISFNYLEERKATLSVPLRIHNFSSYQRFTLYQLVLPASKYTTGEWLFSGSLFGINTNMTTFAVFLKKTDPNIYSNLSLSLRLPFRFAVIPQTQFSYSQKRFLSTKVGIEKHFFDYGFMNLAYEHNFISRISMAEVGFRYDFSFAQTGLSVRQNSKKTSFIQYARGSLLHDRKTKYLGTDNRTNVGKGGIAIVPYLDLNANGIKDRGEPKAYGLNIHTNSGRIDISESDTTIRILGLEPYTNCFVELDPDSFDNISWRLKFKSLSVTVDPDILKLVEIPVSVVGEASGKVMIENGSIIKGLGRVIISFYTNDHRLIGKTLSEDDGYFSFLGLAPGAYMVEINKEQLNKLELVADPERIEFRIVSGIDGDIIDNLNFNLKNEIKTTVLAEPNPEIILKSDSSYSGDIISDNIINKAITETRKDTSYIITHEETKELVSLVEEDYTIQIGAFRKKSNALTLKEKLEKLFNNKVEIVEEDGFYKVRLTGLKNRDEVKEKQEILSKNGYNDVWLTNIKGNDKHWITGEKNDSTIKISEDKIYRRNVTSDNDLSIQIGAFRQEQKAADLKARISELINKPVVIIHEDGYFKVRLKGFDDKIELERYLSELERIGLKDYWIPSKNGHLPVNSSENAPEINLSDTIIYNLDSKTEKNESIINEPPISLHVGMYHNRYQAVSAQRKISSKLKLPVKIIQQWDYYHVVVTGFYTKEETSRFYPELTGLGFPNISIIEKK